MRLPVHCAAVLAAVLGLSSYGCHRGGGGGGGSNPPPGEGPDDKDAPPEETTAAWGEISADEAVALADEQASKLESIAAGAVDGGGARALTDRLSEAPADGGPSESQSGGLGLTSATTGGCDVSTAGDSTDADHDWAPVGATTSYKCDWNGDGWSYKSEGSWAAKDHDDSDAEAGARYDIPSNTYSGSRQNDGKESTYSGSSKGFGDFQHKKDGSNTYDTNWESTWTEDSRTDHFVYIFASTFKPAEGHSDTIRKGTIQLSGFFRQDRKDGDKSRTFILETKGKDLVLDDVACINGSFKSGEMTLVDAKGHKVTMTYANCKRTIAMDDVDLTDKSKEREEERKDDNLVSCKVFSANEGDQGSDDSDSDYTLSTCSTIDLRAAGVEGDSRQEKIETLQAACDHFKYPPWHVSQLIVGRACAAPKKGYGCLGGNFYIAPQEDGPKGQEQGTNVKANVFYFIALDKKYEASTKNNCEYGVFSDKIPESAEKIAEFVKFE